MDSAIQLLNNWGLQAAGVVQSCIYVGISGGSRRWARGTPPPPYFWTKLRHEEPTKKNFGDRPHPPPPPAVSLSKDLDDSSPLSHGLDPALRTE